MHTDRLCRVGVVGVTAYLNTLLEQTLDMHRVHDVHYQRTTRLFFNQNMRSFASSSSERCPTTVHVVVINVSRWLHHQLLLLQLTPRPSPILSIVPSVQLGATTGRAGSAHAVPAPTARPDRWTVDRTDRGLFTRSIRLNGFDQWWRRWRRRRYSG